MSAAYRLYSFGDRPVFAAPRALRGAALRRYQPTTAKRAAYRGLVRLAMLLGADRWITRPLEDPLRRAGMEGFEAWRAEVARALGVKTVQAVLVWPPQAERARLYAHLFDAGAPLGFAKLALAPAAAPALAREARALGSLAARGTRRFRTPRVLAAAPSYLVVEPLPASARPLRGGRYPAAAIAELAGPVRHAGAADLERLPWWRRYREAGAPERFDAELAALLARHGARLCRAHGDLGAHNLFRSADDLWIVDWEDASDEAPALTDELGFALWPGLAAALRNPRRALERLHAARIAGAGERSRLDVMLALAYRHAAGIPDATELIRHWSPHD